MKIGDDVNGWKTKSTTEGRVPALRSYVLRLLIRVGPLLLCWG